MSPSELIKEINTLAPKKRMYVIEHAIRSFRKRKPILDLKNIPDLFIDDYNNDSELIAFTSLDIEAFYEPR
ncbi:MAG: hypothetical protein NT007_11820 [Candidatus Kapabacteria bacterium]|nr:hypothetical protein [Candidatus Kapabacteria bacterium]